MGFKKLGRGSCQYVPNFWATESPTVRWQRFQIKILNAPARIRTHVLKPDVKCLPVLNTVQFNIYSAVIPGVFVHKCQKLFLAYPMFTMLLRKDYFLVLRIRAVFLRCVQ